MHQFFCPWCDKLITYEPTIIVDGMAYHKSCYAEKQDFEKPKKDGPKKLDHPPDPPPWEGIP